MIDNRGPFRTPIAMPAAVAALLSPLAAALIARGYRFVEAADMRPSLAAVGSLADWPAFAASWNQLALDQWMADGGRYRRRRHAVYGISDDGGIVREPHQAHYQGLEYNALNGGIARWFEPLLDDIGNSASLTTILSWCRQLFGALSPEVAQWKVEVHQFRIEAGPDMVGQPTPEGAHRDGVDHVLVLMIRRHNIAEGTTTIHGHDKRQLASFTLTEPLDMTFVDDHRCLHGVTPVVPLDATQPAWRDVLVVTFRKKPKP